MSGLNLVKDNASFNTALVLKVVWVCACVMCISWIYAEISWWIKTSVRKIWIIVYLFFTNTCKTSLESPLCADSREVIWMNSRSYFFFFFSKVMKYYIFKWGVFKISEFFADTSSPHFFQQKYKHIGFYMCQNIQWIFDYCLSEL